MGGGICRALGRGCAPTRPCASTALYCSGTCHTHRSQTCENLNMCTCQHRPVLLQHPPHPQESDPWESEHVHMFMPTRPCASTALYCSCTCHTDWSQIRETWNMCTCQHRPVLLLHLPHPLGITGLQGDGLHNVDPQPHSPPRPLWNWWSHRRGDCWSVLLGQRGLLDMGRQARVPGLQDWIPHGHLLTDPDTLLTPAAQPRLCMQGGERGGVWGVSTSIRALRVSSCTMA